MAPSAYADLQIDADFDSASIGSYTIDNENNEIDFALKPDLLGYEYWTNFRVSGVSGKKIVFHITNANRSYFLSNGKHEAQLVYSCDGENWRRLTDYSYSAPVYTFSETFSCDQVQIATFFPYSYEKMIEHVHAVSTSQWATKETLGYSEQGRDINVLKITDPAIPVESKMVIYNIGRQHPAEVSGSHMLEGMIDFLISDHPYARRFRRNYVWYVVPMVNPDGVYLGYTRATSESRDANRDWGNTNSVEVNVVRNHIDSINAAYGIDFFIDWHSQWNNTYRHNFIYAPWRNTFINTLSDWTDFVSQKPGAVDCPADSCYSAGYIMEYTQCDNTFVFEPTPALVSWTQDSLNTEGVNVAFAIDEYLGVSNTVDLGNAHVFSDVTTSDKRRSVPYTMPEDGFIDSITMYHEAGNGRMLLSLYADDGRGNPASQLGVTAETDVSSSAGWQSIELIEPVFVPAGTQIWLAWVYENNPGIRYQSGSPARAESIATWYDGMPAAYGPSSFKNYIYSIYATYMPELATFKDIGNAEVFSSITTSNERRAVPYTMPEDGFIDSISMYHSGGSGKMLLGLYADDGKGNPGSQLMVTAETDVSSIEGWQNIDLIEPVFVPAGAQIWLAWAFENNPGIRYQAGSPARAESNGVWNDRMPAAFGPSSFENYIYSIYASYFSTDGSP
jgi:hypothetical protein